MASQNVYTRALMDRVTNPDYFYKMSEPTLSHEGINPSCGDDLTLDVRLDEDGRIAEVSWTGSGCAVSKGSADMMSDLMVGETPERARELCQLFGRMVRGEESNERLLSEELDEAAELRSISHMPARVKCAELAWRTLDEMLAHPERAGRAASTTEDGTDAEGRPVGAAGGEAGAGAHASADGTGTGR